MLLSMLKKGWEVSKNVLIVLWKYWYIVVISLLLLINTTLRNDIVSLEKDKTKLNNDIVLLVQKQKQDLLEAQKKAKDKEIQILTKQKEVEVKYNEQIKNLQSDVVNANSANARLLNTLETAKSRVSTAPDTEVRDYSNTATELLGECAGRIIYYATKAQEHRVNEERSVNLYNSLIDDGHNLSE